MSRLLRSYSLPSRPTLPAGYQRMQQGTNTTGEWNRYYSRAARRTLFIQQDRAWFHVYEYSGNVVPSCCRGG